MAAVRRTRIYSPSAYKLADRAREHSCHGTLFGMILEARAEIDAEVASKLQSRFDQEVRGSATCGCWVWLCRSAQCVRACVRARGRAGWMCGTQQAKQWEEKKGEAEEASLTLARSLEAVEKDAVLAAELEARAAKEAEAAEAGRAMAPRELGGGE